MTRKDANMKLKPALLLGALALAGCADLSPTVDLHHGAALRQARLAQTIDPQAAQRAGDVSGIDGKAAREAMKRYVDSFKEPPPTINVINIGGSVAGQ